MKQPARLIANPPAGLRERRRSDGSTRIWWEPSSAARNLGFSPVELDEHRLTWSRRQAEKLNRELASAQRSGRRAPRAIGTRSIDALIQTYTQSLAFTELRPKTQASYQANFRLIGTKWGSQHVRDFTKPVMRVWYESLYAGAGPYQAQALIRAMSLLFSHAELIGWRAEGTNPCYRLKMKTPPPRDRWATWAEIDALLAAADREGLPSIGTAILLSLLQGQRQTDVIAARRGDFDQVGDRIVWSFTRSKRNNAAALWLHDEVADRLRNHLERTTDPARRLLQDEISGADYDTDLLGRRWRKVRDVAVAADRTGKMARLSSLQFRDLRRTFGVLSRAGGSTRDDTADVLGNSAATNPRLAQTYMPGQIDTASRAVDAIRRPSTPTPKRRA